MPALLIAILAGMTAGAFGAAPAWVLGGVTVLVIGVGFAVATASGLAAWAMVALCILAYNLALAAGLLLRADREARSR
jgi:hypothetical protein